jgi:hypothetical protein
MSDLGRRCFLATSLGTAGSYAVGQPSRTNYTREFLSRLKDYRGLFFACTEDDGPLFTVDMDGEKGRYSLFVSCKGVWERNEKGLYLFKGFKGEPLEVARIYGGLIETRGDIDLDGRPDFYRRTEGSLSDLTSGSTGLRLNRAYVDRVTKVNIVQLPEREARRHVEVFEGDLRTLIEAMDKEVRGRGLTPPIPVREKRRC